MQESYSHHSNSDGRGSLDTRLESRMDWEHLAYACVSLKRYLIKKLQAHETKAFVWLSLV